MNTYRNKNFVRRDYDCTNVVFCQTPGMPPNDGRSWVLCNDYEIESRNCTQLWRQGDATYFGYL